jgi:hypothetical protein
MIDILPKFIH